MAKWPAESVALLRHLFRRMLNYPRPSARGPRRSARPAAGIAGSVYHRAGVLIVGYFWPKMFVSSLAWDDSVNVLAAIIAWRKFDRRTCRAAGDWIAGMADSHRERVRYTRQLARAAKRMAYPLNRALALEITKRPDLTWFEARLFIQRWLAAPQ